MAKSTCAACGKETQETKGWSSCPDCAKNYCPTCVDGHNKEKRELEKLRKSSTLDRVTATCPSCYADLQGMY